jgi:nucleoside 2-deoxyribosyltransferase
MTKRKLYIAGPMTGYPKFNVPAFDAAAKHFQEAGWEVLNPADLAREHGTDKPHNFYMKLALGLLLQCDSICMLPGWAHSRGASLEYDVALAAGLLLIFMD